jgi:hypothetical protein
MVDRLAGDQQRSRPDEAYPDERQEGLELSAFDLVGASVRGKMHIRNGIGREDAFAIYREGDWVAIAVSDGVGSSRHASLGATFAVNNVCQSLLDEIHKIVRSETSFASICQNEMDPTDEKLSEAMRASYENTSAGLQNRAGSLRDEHAEKENPVKTVDTDIEANPFVTDMIGTDSQLEKPKGKNHSIEHETKSFSYGGVITVSDLHCTLLTLLINIKSGTMVCGQVGDGLILGLTRDNEARPIIEPRTPEQTGQVHAITQRDWYEFWDGKILSGAESADYITLYLMTDGVADDCQYGPPDDILQRWAADMDAEVRKYDVSLTKVRLAKYLANYEAKGSFDDRTLVVLYKPIPIKQAE